MGRTASGVIGFNLDEGDYVVGASTDREGSEILSITENGYGKRTDLEEYRKTKRGAKGVNTIIVNERNGKLAALRTINGDEELLLMSNEGSMIRISVDNVGKYGRSTMGVKVFNLSEGDFVASTTVLMTDEDEENEEIEENNENSES